MIVKTPYGDIQTIPLADEIFRVVPKTEEEADKLIQQGALAVYMKYGCPRCSAEITLLNLSGHDRLMRVAAERNVPLVYFDLSAFWFYGFFQEKMIDKVSTIVFYKGGRELARYERPVRADVLASLIEQNFPVQ
ncbi:hypothetical protein FJZ19_04165 [Candidatus Pacearchaeota archaeon]|nr:hypothetical protein [Candidatus Pacearchaeota archaeon]